MNGVVRDSWLGARTRKDTHTRRGRGKEQHLEVPVSRGSVQNFTGFAPRCDLLGQCPAARRETGRYVICEVLRDNSKQDQGGSKIPLTPGRLSGKIPLILGGR